MNTRDFDYLETALAAAKNRFDERAPHLGPLRWELA